MNIQAKALGFCLRSVAFVFGTVALVSSLTAGVEGEAFWGSFGEGAGRVECAVFKSASTSEIVGYDAETETAFYSTDVNWDADEHFDFQGIAIRSNDVVSALGNGASTQFSADEDSVLLLSGTIDDEGLAFETFASGAATYHIFELLGQTRASLRIVEGSEGECFVLFTDDRGVAYGDSVAALNEGGFEFVTPSGDVFNIDFGTASDSVVGAYALADGRTGQLSSEVSSVDGGLEVSSVESIWMVDTSMDQQESSSMHVILEGEGVKTVQLNSTVNAFGFDGLSEIKAVVSKLAENGIFEEVLVSEAFETVAVDSLEGVKLSGNMEFELAAGTYLVRLSGLLGSENVSELVLGFPNSSGPAIINASTLYLAGQVEDGRSFGFSLGGEGHAKAIIRNVGPSLSQFDLPSNTSDPRMAIYKNASKSWKNDDWSLTVAPHQLSAEMSALGAFELGAESKDAVVELTLAAGDYEVVPQGNQKESGFESVEVYFQ